MSTRIDEIRARLADATAGPWQRHDSEFYGVITGLSTEADPSDPTGQTPMQVEVEVAHVGLAADAEFITSSADDVAYLLAELDRAGARVQAMLACAAETENPGEPEAGAGFAEGLEHGDFIRCEAIRRAAAAAGPMTPATVDGPF